MLVRGAPADLLQQLLSNSLEWRREAQLAAPRANGSDTTVHTPVTWGKRRKKKVIIEPVTRGSFTAGVDKLRTVAKGCCTSVVDTLRPVATGSVTAGVDTLRLVARGSCRSVVDTLHSER